MRVTAGRPDARSFAPFGAFVRMPDRVGGRGVYSDWLAPVAGLAPTLYTNRVSPVELPLTIDRVERHPHAAQMFLPLKATRYLVTVMPADASGAPSPALAVAVLLPPTMGVVYHPGIWHTGITALDEEASFAVLMYRGAPDDDVFAAVAPLVIDEPGEGG